MGKTPNPAICFLYKTHVNYKDKHKKIGTVTLTSDKTAFKTLVLGFPAGAVLKNAPANAGDTGSSPGPGRSHMPWSN